MEELRDEMTVSELIEILSAADGKTKVFICSGTIYGTSYATLYVGEEAIMEYTE